MAMTVVCPSCSRLCRYLLRRDGWRCRTCTGTMDMRWTPVVEVTLSDGTTVRREARASPRTLIFQDRNEAAAVFERRLAAAGCGPARRLADLIFAAAEQNAPLGVGDVLDGLTQRQ